MYIGYLFATRSCNANIFIHINSYFVENVTLFVIFMRLSMSYSYHNFDRVSSYSKLLLFGRRERFVRLFERVDSGIAQTTNRHTLHAQSKKCVVIFAENIRIYYRVLQHALSHKVQFSVVRNFITCSSLLHVQYQLMQNKT